MARSVFSSPRTSVFGIFVVALFAVACGSSSSASAGSIPNGTFTANAGSAGTFTCYGATQAYLSAPNGELFIECNVDPGPDQQTPALLDIGGYHGTDTYAFRGDAVSSGNGLASQVDITIENSDLSTTAGNATSLPSTCTVTLTGPAALVSGDDVQGTFHCDNIAIIPPYSDPTSPSYVPPTYGISLDGSFDAFDSVN